MKIYLAGPCDTENRTMMVQIARYLREKEQEVYCPWELKIEDAWDISQEEWAKKVFEADVAAIDNSDMVLIISLGRVSTAGTNWEQGYAYAKGIHTHVIQVNNNSTSLMTYWGCDNFINLDKTYTGMASELQWIIDHETNVKYHGKCRTVLT